jgi:esterase/lipase superfamily enzyme
VTRQRWVAKVMEQARCGINPRTDEPTGDILVFVHGYNNDLATVIWRHRQLERDLAKAGYRGAVVSFDWPSNDVALNYLEDRSDARKTSAHLVEDCIRLFSATQHRGCEINVHLLAHSTGAYVVREAFDAADDTRGVASVNWSVSQVCLIGADVSQRSMAESDSKSRSLYRHCVRLTNYQNPYDSILKLSNIKRVGVAPRVGRIGLPADASPKAVNVNCAARFGTLDAKKAVFRGAFDHSWQIGDRMFARDLRRTLQGDVDRYYISTRHRGPDGGLWLNAK